ncbi:MAG: hypothetical protein MJ114_02360 [Acetatifactor sp.]|nr:hypothetical protein [Acetatifactor sp.]
MKSKKERIILGLCNLCFFLVMLKELCTGIFPDEEYQIVMSYRLAAGDGLFHYSWDTIQTSGFINYILIKAYTLVHDTQGLVLFLRTCGMLIQCGVYFVLLKTLERHMSKIQAGIVGTVMLLTVPKLILSPDFSNMQQWFSVLMLCALWKAYDGSVENDKLSKVMLVLAALCNCGIILSQACFVIIPIEMLALCLLFPKKKWKSNLWFWGTCAVTGILYFLMILINNGWNVTMTGIRGILAGDMTHASGANIVGQSVLISLIKNGAQLGMAMAAAFLIAFAFVFCKCKVQKLPFRWRAVGILALLVSCVYTLYLWLIKGYGYDAMKLYIPVSMCLALVILGVKAKKKEALRDYLLPFVGMLVNLGIFVNVLFISNVPMINNLSFLSTSVVWSLVILCLSVKEEREEKIWNAVALGTVLLTVCVATGFTLPSSPSGNNILSCRQRICCGPARSIFTAERTAKVYSTAAHEFAENIQEGSKVLLVSNSFDNTLVNYCYLMKDVEISHYSVNSTPTYSMKLEEYWNLYPEKYPDVIAVNKNTYTTWEWDWILLYVRDYYGYKEVVNTESFDFYYR